MDTASYQQWWQLHLQVAGGDALRAEDRAVYDAGCQSLEQDEQLRHQTDTRQARQEWLDLEAAHSKLEDRRHSLSTQIAQLETRLSDQTRQFLGVED